MSDLHGGNEHGSLPDSVIDGMIAQAYAYGMQLVDDEVPPLTQFLLRHRFGNILEIGAESGGLFFLLCALTAADGKKLALDAPSPATTAERSRRLQFYPGQVHELLMDPSSEDALNAVRQRLGPDRLDLLVIGGNRSYLAARRNFEMYRHLVRRGGWIAFFGVKDTEFHRRTGNELPKLWTELRQDRAVTFVADASRIARPRWVWERQLREAELLFVTPDWGGIGLKQVEAEI